PLGQVACQVLAPALSGYRRYCPYTLEPGASGAWTGPDLARAQELVRSSGTAGQRVTVWIGQWTQFGPAVGRYLVSVLDSLGYRARYRIGGGLSVKSTLRLQAAFSGWYPDFATPSSFVGPTLTCAASNPAGSGSANIAGFCDPLIDREMAL